jgi:16S rRNA (uracil1498-N3)-methyltransferase
MPKFFVTNQNVNDKEITIVGEDVNHIKNVLRKKIGEQLTICNVDMMIDYLCEILQIEENIIKCNILEELETNSESNIKVSIFQGLPKADKMEMVIQKSVELGVYDITPVEMKRCVVKLNDKDKRKKIERWQKISEVAAKQSGRNRIPKINEIKSIKNVCNLCEEYDIVIVAYENEQENKIKNELKNIKLNKKDNLKIAVIIGPEGGIEETEIKLLKNYGAKIVTLGNRILRTETVALNVLSIIMYEFEN